MLEIAAETNLSQSSEPGALECSVTAFSAIRMSSEEANALRKQSKSLPGDLGNSILRHSDEQTLTTLFAVRETLKEFESVPDFDQWGVVCSSRYLGRAAFADALVKFAAEGPWNVSVQVVPNRSLHSPASMVGLALGCHGPCVGVGGGLDGETDAWITAMTLLEQQHLSGMLLIFCGWDADEKVDLEGRQLNQPQCTSLVMALQPASVAHCAARMRLAMDPVAPVEVEIPAQQTALNLFERFVAQKQQGGSLSAMLGGGLRAVMNWEPAQSIRMVPPETGSDRIAA